MTKTWWRDFKFHFFQSGGVSSFYIGLNIVIFVLVSLASIVCFFAGSAGLIQELVANYFSFPSYPSLWLSRCYTLITYQFFHLDFLHILFNMLWLYWMGRLFLDFMKPRQFHFVYIGGGILGAVFFALIVNIVPQFAPLRGLPLIGASAAVMAIFAAITTLIPNYSLQLLFIGQIKIKYLLAVYVLLDLIAVQGFDGGSIAHLGGAIFGFLYVKLLQSGNDLTFLFKRKPKMKVVKNEQPKKSAAGVNQKEVDAILDKISKSGYDKLTKEEKEILFKASKN